jgi:DNA-binding NtrC family response regulator
VIWSTVTGERACGYLDEVLLGEHASIGALKQMIQLAAGSALPVLIEGETGTGKEVVAHALHRLSGRPGHFTAVNVSSLQEQLADAELFGAEKGAYTGAHIRRLGLVEQAGRGTLFLDEAGDLPRWLQAKLLRTLEDGAVRPLGGGDERRVDFRLIVSTQQPPDRLLHDGRWREDFFFRIAGVRLRLAPLRERRSDIPVLAAAFLRRLARAEPVDDILSALTCHPWPGNVRQLLRVIQRAVLLAGQGAPSHAEMRQALADEDELWDLRLGTPEPERSHRDPSAIIRAIASASNYAGAARRLGISVRTLHRRLDAFGLRGEPTEG